MEKRVIVSGRVYVAFKQGVSVNDQERIIRELGLTIRERIRKDNFYCLEVLEGEEIAWGQKFGARSDVERASHYHKIDTTKD